MLAMLLVVLGHAAAAVLLGAAYFRGYAITGRRSASSAWAVSRACWPVS